MDAALARLFEPPCAACGALVAHPLDGAVCAVCWASLHPMAPPLCQRCGDPLLPLQAWPVIGVPAGPCARCRRTPPLVTAARSVGLYEGRLRDIVHALKYGGRQSVVAPLQALLKDAGAGLLHDADVVVPVPLHPRRQWQRGFNQATLLAAGLDVPVAMLLRRVVHTPPQVDLPAADRRANVRGAFALSRAWQLRVGRGRWARALRARRVVAAWLGDTTPPAVVVLVDDVMTTGATLDACARVLKAAGVREVRALTVARVASGPRPAPPR